MKKIQKIAVLIIGVTLLIKNVLASEDCSYKVITLKSNKQMENQNILSEKGEIRFSISGEEINNTSDNYEKVKSIFTDFYTDNLVLEKLGNNFNSEASLGEGFNDYIKRKTPQARKHFKLTDSDYSKIDYLVFTYGQSAQPFESMSDYLGRTYDTK